MSAPPPTLRHASGLDSFPALQVCRQGNCYMNTMLENIDRITDAYMIESQRKARQDWAPFVDE